MPMRGIQGRIVTAYYLCHGHWTVIPHQIDEDFQEMVDCGFSAVAISFSESEMEYSRRAVELQTGLARKRGLKVFLVPSRIGGRFAGAPLMPSLWLATNPRFQVPADYWMPLACLESREFLDWAGDFVGTIVRDYELDGIIWDEPKGVDVISRHPDTVAKYGSEPTVEQMMESFVGFLGMLIERCLEIRPGLAMTLFAQKMDPEYFTSRAARINGIEYFGFDGNLARQSMFHEAPAWRKYRIESVWERTLKECAAAGRKTFALVENMLMPAEAMGEYEANLNEYLDRYRPDHLAIYYYAHNNEDPEKVHAITRQALKRHLL